MDEEPESTPSDILPPVANRLIGISWIILFAGRWTVVQLLLAAGVLSPSMVTELDDQILIKLYLVLLAVTITVVILRAMRGAKAQPSSSGLPQSNDVSLTGPTSSSSSAPNRSPNTRD